MVADGPDRKGRSGAYAWWVVAVLTLTYIVAFIDRQLLAVLVEPIKRDLALSDVQISLVLGLAFAIFYTSIGVVSGWLCDRVNRRTLLVGASLIWSLATAAGGLANNFQRLLLARMGVGLGESCLNPAAMSLISDYFPRERLGRALGVYSLGIAIGGGLAIVIGGAALPLLEAGGAIVLPLIGATRPWQTLMIVVGLSGLVTTLLLLSIRDPRARHRARTGERPVSFRRAIGYVANHRLAYFGLCWPIIAGALLAIAIGSWIPSFFIRTYGMTPVESGEAIGTWGLILMGGNIVGGVGGGFLIDAMAARRADGHLRAILLGLLVAGPAYILFPQAPTPGLALALLVPAALGSGLLQACGATSLLGATPGGMRGQVSALYFLAINAIGTGLGPTAVALLTDHVFGSPALIGHSLSVLAAFATLSGIAALLVSRRAYLRLAAAQTETVPPSMEPE